MEDIDFEALAKTPEFLFDCFLFVLLTTLPFIVAIAFALST